MTDLSRLKNELIENNIDFVDIKEKFTPGIKITVNNEDLKIIYGATSLGIEARLPNGEEKRFLNVANSLKLVSAFLKGGD